MDASDRKSLKEWYTKEYSSDEFTLDHFKYFNDSIKKRRVNKHRVKKRKSYLVVSYDEKMSFSDKPFADLMKWNLIARHNFFRKNPEINQLELDLMFFIYYYDIVDSKLISVFPIMENKKPITWVKGLVKKGYIEKIRFERKFGSVQEYKLTTKGKKNLDRYYAILLETTTLSTTNSHSHKDDRKEAPHGWATVFKMHSYFSMENLRKVKERKQSELQAFDS